ncbi:type 4a pilus biogenesis protein PilO [Patescibacteria group bacterium]|nr:type 4a pilus biogenesis protein PilO [Patescibacteria group bacterium]
MRNYDRYYQQIRVWDRQPKVRVSGLISLTIFTVAFFLNMAILPTFKTIAGLKKEIKDQQEVEAKLTKKMVGLKTAEVNYAKVVNDLKLINQVLPEKEEFERLAWQIQWLANQKGVKINAGRFGEFNLVGEADSSDQAELVVEITIKGSYQQIRDFLQSLIKIDRLITIKEISFNKQDLQTGGELTASLKLAGFYLPIKE